MCTSISRGDFMITYIRDRHTFALKHHATALNYDMTVQSIYDEVSDFKI